MRKVRRIRWRGQDVELIAEQLAAVPASTAAIDTQVAFIQELIPQGLLHVQESLQQEVERLAGPRYARQGGAPGVVRYGKQPGSICHFGDEPRRPSASASSALFGVICRARETLAHSVPEGNTRFSAHRRPVAH